MADVGSSPKAASAGAPRRAAHSGIVKASSTPIAIRNRSKKYASGIGKRNPIKKEGEVEEDNGPKLSKAVVLFLIFVVVGSAIVGIASAAMGGSKVSAQ